MKDFRFSKKRLFIIFSISISAILVSSFTVPVFGDNFKNDAHHDNNLNRDTKAILLKFAGGGDIASPYLSSSLKPLEDFMDANMGTHHDSAWNKFHLPNDLQGITYPASVAFGTCNPPDGSGGIEDCNWIDAKQDALNYINANPDKKIVLAGHHFGGGAATFLGQELGNNGRQVEGIFLTDPIGPGIVGSSRAGIMQECDIDNINPIDSSCTRFKLDKTCSSHKDSVGNPFKLVGITTCGKDVIIPACPATADSFLGFVGFKRCLADLECPSGAFVNTEYGFVFVCERPATGSPVVDNSVNNCPAGTKGNIHGACTIRKAGFTASTNSDTGACPSGTKAGAPVWECLPNTCPPGFTNAGLFCQKDLPHTCPVDTIFNDGKTACIVAPSVRNFELDSPYSPNCVVQGKNCVNTCPFGMLETVSVNECNAGQRFHTGLLGPQVNHRVMNEKIKGITVSYQTQSLIPADNISLDPFFGTDGPWSFLEWESHVKGFFDHFKFFCNPLLSATCHQVISFEPPKQNEFINHLKSLNAKPTISIASGTDLEILEGESAPDGLTMVSTDDTGVGETIGDMKLFLRLGSLEGGIEPTSELTEVEIDDNTIQKQVSFTINVDTADGPGSFTRTVWVEDNGWPCDDCSTDPNDGGATGKWNKADVTINIVNVPPTPILVGELSPTRTKEFTFNAIDPSADDQAAGFKYVVTWWDGTQGTIDILTVGDVVFPAPQIIVPGEYTFQVTAEDKDGGISDPVFFTIKILDTDDDGIADVVDTLPEEFSDDFSDVNFCGVGIPNEDTGLCEIDPSCSIGVFNIETDKCETEPLCDADFTYNPETNFCEMDVNTVEPSCIDEGKQDFNPDTDACETSHTCPDSTTLNSEINMCVTMIIPGGTDGRIVEREDQGISILEEPNPDGIFFNADNVIEVKPATILACDDVGELTVDSGDSGKIKCGSITVSIITGSVDVKFFTHKTPATTTMGPTDSLTFDNDGKTLKFTNNSLTTPAIITIVGRTFSIPPGETLTFVFPSSSVTYQDPNLGDVRHGTGHENGFCMNQNCINVDGFFNHFPETIVPQGSTQTFSLLINCPRGVDTCNHASIEGVLPDSEFYEEQWGVTLDRIPRSDTWETTINNPYGEISDVTTTVQEVGQSFLSVSYNIKFQIPGSIGTADGLDSAHENNRHLHVTVWDNNRGVSNYIFNEGVYVNDIYAYPQVDASYEAPLEVQELCLNEDSTNRYTCAFDKVKDWTIEKAEKALFEINGKNQLDVLEAEFLVLFKEHRQAIADGDSEKTSELRELLDELGARIYNMKQ